MRDFVSQFTAENHHLVLFFLNFTQAQAGFVAYGLVLEYSLDDGGSQLVLSFIEMSMVTSGESCFAGGPIPFTMINSQSIHIPYLLFECTANFIFQVEVSYCNCMIMQ